jgi:hypothetical protein
MAWFPQDVNRPSEVAGYGPAVHHGVAYFDSGGETVEDQAPDLVFQDRD